MFKHLSSFPFAAGRIAIFAAIALVLLSLSAAGSGTPGLSLMETVEEFFGIQPTRTTVILSQIEESNHLPKWDLLAPLAVDQYFDGSGTNALTASKWATTNAGPFTSNFMTGNTAVFATVNGTGTGAGGISVGGIRAEENFTYSAPTGTLSTGGTAITVNVFDGKKLDIGTLALSTASGTGFVKSGAGEWVVSNGGAYSGGFTLNAGTMTVGGVNAMGGAPANMLKINGGTLRTNTAAALDFTGKFGGGITFGGDFEFGLAADGGAGNMTFNNNVAIGSLTRTITNNSSGDTILSGIISGTGTAGLTVSGAGTGALTLSGLNTYAGSTTLSGSILSVPTIGAGGFAGGIGMASNAAANLVFDGGTLRFTGTTASTDRNFTINSGKTAIIEIANTNGELTISGASIATNGALIKSGKGLLYLSGTNLYSGNTTINAGGALALKGGGSIANSPVIEISGGGYFDVVALSTVLTLASGQALKASGTTSSGTISTKAGNGLTTASDSPLQFTGFNGTTAPLKIQGPGTITLASGNPVTVNTTSALGLGDYVLISKGTSGTVAGSVPTSLSIGGNGIAAGTTASLVISGGQLVLRVVAQPTINVTAPVGGLNFGGVVVGETSGEQTFTVSGSNLTGGISVISGAAEIEVSKSSGGGFGSSITFTPSGASVPTSTVYVRFKPKNSNLINSTITISSTGAGSKSVTVAGHGIVPTHTITASAGTNGMIDPSGAITVNDGANQTFVITPETGYHVADVLLDGGTVGAMVSYSFTGVTADHTIAASFAADVCTAPPSDMIAWWRAENNADDVFGTNNGAWVGTAVYSAGKVEQAFDLSGSGDYVRVATPVGLPVGSAPRTMMLWFKTPGTWTDPYAMLMQYGGTDGSSKFGLMVPDYGSRKLGFWGEGNDLTGPTVLQPNTWYHGTVTYDGSTLQLYLNGQLEASGGKSLNTYSSSDFTIGRTGSNSNITGEWNGLIDEAVVFDRALSQAEIQAIYNAGAAGMCHLITVNPTSLPNGTVGVEYTNSVTASGGATPYTFAITSGDQPTGLSLNSDGTWSGSPSATGTFNFTVTANDAGNYNGSRAYTVVIDPAPQFLLIVNRNGTGTGSVTNSPSGISCGATCSASFNSGQIVKLTELPDPGSTFTGWNGGSCSGTMSTCDVTMDAAKGVTATFDDITPPDTFIDPTTPSDPTNSTSATFTFHGVDTLAGSKPTRADSARKVVSSATLSFQCSLDSASFTSCASPQAYTGLSDGLHNFQVRAIDTAGNVDPAPASYSWTIDTAPPVIAAYNPLTIAAANTAVPLTVSVTDNHAMGSVSLVYWVNGIAQTAITCAPATLPAYDCLIPAQDAGSAVAYYVAAIDTAGNGATSPSLAPNLYTISGAPPTIPTGAYSNLDLSDGSALGGDVSTDGVLTLGGTVSTGPFTLSLGCDASVSGAGGYNYVVGNLKKEFCSEVTFIFPVGTTPDNAFAGVPDGPVPPPDPEYSPFTVKIDPLGSTFPASLTVSVLDEFLPDSDSTQSASRYWDLSQTGGTLKADISFKYFDQDVAGDDTNYKVLRRESGSTDTYFGGTVDAATNTATALGVSSFSQWAAGNLAPTAAGVSLGGRVLTADGSGIRNARIYVSGNKLPSRISTMTGPFGYYRFDNIAAGETYVVTVQSKRFTFNAPSAMISLTDNLTDVDFRADPAP